MKSLVCQSVLAGMLCTILVGCNQNPQEIKAKTEKATREAKQDVKAVTQGVRDGLKSDKKQDNNSKKESPRKP